MDFTELPADSPALDEILDLERLGPSAFRGRSQPGTSMRLFGGEVVGQAIRAATRSQWGRPAAGAGTSAGGAGGTPPAAPRQGGRVAHHAHASFLRVGDSGIPVTYTVEAVRVGKSYTTCRVDATQNAELILTMTVGLTTPTTRGLHHQLHPPQVAPPEQLRDPRELYARDAGMLDWLDRYLVAKPFELRFPTPPARAQITSHGVATARQRAWVRLNSPLPDSRSWRAGAFAYISDAMLLSTALGPHGLHFAVPHLQFATLSHTMWLHEDADPADWLLYDMTGEWNGHERGFCTGVLYGRDGTRLASFAQEGVLRIRE